MVQVDKRLLWHPRHDNKFVVGGNSQITLYEWAAEYPEIRHVTSQHDLQFMKCFAWSPDPAFEDLIAVGLSTGKVDLIRLEAGKQAQRKNVLSSGPSVTLPVRSSRSCNALEFCTVDPNYLAVGLDKVRGDSSLVIWDISSLAPSLSLPLNGSHDLTLLNTEVPLQTRPHPRIPRFENQARLDPRILQQHAPTEVVSSLAFLPASTHLLLAGISHRWLRLFDLRSPAIAPFSVASKVHGIATDPFDPHRIACFGDAVITVWDARRLNQPLLMFSERDALGDGARTKPGSSFANIEFSSTRRGCLATLERDSTYVRFWDLTESRVHVEVGAVGGGGGSSDGETRSLRESGRGVRRSWAANLPWPTGSVQSLPSSRDSLANSLELPPSLPSFVLADTRRTKYFPKSLASFALVPSPKSSRSLTSNVMVVNKDGDLELYAVHDTPKQVTWSSRGDLALGAGLGIKVLEGYHDPEEDDEFSSDFNLHQDHQHQPSASQFLKSQGSHSTDVGEPSRSRSGPHPGPSTSLRDQSRGRGRSSGNSSTHRGVGVGVGASLPHALPVAPSAVPPFFGKDDDDGFTALSSGGKPTGLSATRPGKPRTYSPASARKYRSIERGEPSALVRKRSVSRTDTVPADEEEPVTKRGIGRAAPPAGQRALSRAREAKRQGLIHVVQDDISMIIRRRAKAAYGLTQPQHNATVTQDDHEPSDGTTQTLSEIWSWLHHSQEILCIPTPHLHGYDFSYHGVLGIWEGLKLPNTSTSTHQHQHQHAIDDTPIAHQRPILDVPPLGAPLHTRASSNGSTGTGPHSRRSQSPADNFTGDWSGALAVLAARRGVNRTSWRPLVKTDKLVERQIALEVCGWSLREEEVARSIKRWEKEGRLSKAACWLVFTGQHNKAVDLLMRSDDETHQMMSGTVAVLSPPTSNPGLNRGVELREHYGRLIIRLNDPYFRAMLTHLVLGDWNDVLDEEVIPFRERLSIALQFLDDRALSSYLRRTVDRACTQGDIDALIVTGLTPVGLNVLQAYVDRTGDVQTAAILSSYVCPQKFKDRRAERWLETYRDLLDGFKLHRQRVTLDIERGVMLFGAVQNGDMVPEDWAPKQILIRCHYCNKPVSNPAMPLNPQPMGRPIACQNCSRELPRCSVCLMTLSIVHDAAREVDLGYTHHRDTFDDAIVICQTCRHGGHAVHVLEWFFGEDSERTRDVCAVADCDCRCADEF